MIYGHRKAVETPGDPYDTANLLVVACGPESVIEKFDNCAHALPEKKWDKDPYCMDYMGCRILMQ